MHAKIWAFEGLAASLIALGVTYIILEPTPVVLDYAGLLGWSGIIGVLIVTVQGFRIFKKHSDFRGATGIEHYETTTNRWGGIHTASQLL